MSFIRRILDAITAHIVITMGVGVLVGVGVAVWAFLTDLGAWSMVIGLAIPMILVQTANGVQEYFEKRPRKLSAGELVTQMSAWLNQQGYDVVRKASDGSSEIAFELHATFQPGKGIPPDLQKIVIERFADDKEPLVLSASTGYDEAMREKWMKLPNLTRADCIAQAQIEMMRFGFNFTGLGDELEVHTIIKRLPVQIYYGNRVTSEKAFIEEVQLVRRGSKIIELLVRKALVT